MTDLLPLDLDYDDLDVNLDIDGVVARGKRTVRRRLAATGLSLVVLAGATAVTVLSVGSSHRDGPGLALIAPQATRSQAPATSNYHGHHRSSPPCQAGQVPNLTLDQQSGPLASGTWSMPSDPAVIAFADTQARDSNDRWLAQDVRFDVDGTSAYNPPYHYAPVPNQWVQRYARATDQLILNAVVEVQSDGHSYTSHGVATAGTWTAWSATFEGCVPDSGSG